MTAQEKRGLGNLSRSDLLLCLTGAAALLSTFLFSRAALGAMSEGMSLCVRTVIPSLFPFMVISELLVSTGVARRMGRLLGRPLSRIFSLSPDGAAALALGLICGFPVGSRCALSLYERGRICRGELEHLLTFCNSPSSAFLSGAVGVGLFASESFGLLLYLTHLISSLTVGLLSKRYFAERKALGEYCRTSAVRTERRGGISLFCNAVCDSAHSMLCVCAFVIFFSAVSGVLRHLVELFGAPEALSVLLLGLLEMTGGVNAATALPSAIAPVAVAAVTGWSGLSVAFQLGGLCKDSEVSLTPYFISKALCALFNAALIAVALYLIGGISSLPASESVSLLLPMGGALSPLWISLFIGGCVAIRPRR